MSEARIAIRRRDGWDTFSLPFEATTTLIEILFSIRQKPITIEGQLVSPPAFESACASDGCGACALLVNGRARVACRTRVSTVLVKGRVELEPLSKFPLIRDLWVDRRRVRESFARVAARLEPDAERRPVTKTFALRDRCIECGACLEACPEWGTSSFIGPAALNEARLSGIGFSGDGGVESCGKAQNCVEVCPEKIPLFDSILELERDATRHWLETLLRR